MSESGHATDNRAAIRMEYITVVQKVMWTAICNRCGADIFAESDEVAWSSPGDVDAVMDGYWRCKCGAPLDRMEAELQAEAAEEGEDA
jgi:hypothetical protein